MTLFSVTRKARVTDVKMKQSAAAGTEVVVGLAFRRADLTEEERSALFDYYGNQVEVEIAAIHRDDDPAAPRPMERLWAQAEADDEDDSPAEERMRPLPDAMCGRCKQPIGEDPDARFDVPIGGGPPYPLHGTCYEEWNSDREIVEQREREEREQFIAARDSVERTSELVVALTDAYDSGDTQRRLAARVLVGLDVDPAYTLPEDPDEFDALLTWLRQGDLQAETDEPVEDGALDEVTDEDASEDEGNESDGGESDDDEAADEEPQPSFRERAAGLTVADVLADSQGDPLPFEPDPEDLERATARRGRVRAESVG